MISFFLDVLVFWLAAANLAGFALMGFDKLCAWRDHRRVPERVLFLVALAGGSLGSWVGMYWFRHKTRHWYFVAGMPLILVCQLALAVWIAHKTGALVLPF